MGVTVGAIRRMTTADVAAVADLEGASFDMPWPPEVFFEELSAPNRWYLVAECEHGVTAYGGIMLIDGDAHVMTIAVSPDHRRGGAGSRMLMALVDAALEMGANAITLEVAVSNRPAIALYEAFGFEAVGTRPEYYGGEDALILGGVEADGPGYRALLDEMRGRLS
jgi:ribosomal-protein-alanine N-acetyltransferase